MAKHRGKDAACEGEVEVEHSVLAYLHCHPQAADTLRGIVNWWLPQQRYEDGCRRVEHVLSGLVAKGLLHCNQLPDGEVLYALNKHTRSQPPH